LPIKQAGLISWLCNSHRWIYEVKMKSGYLPPSFKIYVIRQCATDFNLEGYECEASVAIETDDQAAQKTSL
jgi:hypothetical protein